jgi:hypothetical protein
VVVGVLIERGRTDLGTWRDVVVDAEGRHGVTSRWRADQLGLDSTTFYRRSAAAGWEPVLPGVRIAPGRAQDLRSILVAVADATRGQAVAAGRTATWLHGLREWPPQLLEVLVPHELSPPPRHRRIVVRRARWLRAGDMIDVDAVRTLNGPALALSAARWPAEELRGLLIDGSHRGILDLEELLERLVDVGPIPGKGALRKAAHDLLHRGIESVFEDDVRTDLSRRGYQPAPGPQRIETPDGRGLTIDIALPWKVAVEPEGDLYHRTREQRRADRRRTAQYAGTDWVPVPVDWRDWQLEPDRVRRAIDAALLAQQRAGRGGTSLLPPHLRERRAAEREGR